jgi:DNA-binding YbaB/EbfC family protein
MANIFKMMKDTVLAQKNLKKIQNELQQKTVEYSSAGGEVRVTARGDASLVSIKIDPAAVAPDRTGKLEKMILEAVNGALEEAKKNKRRTYAEINGRHGLAQYSRALTRSIESK